MHRVSAYLISAATDTGIDSRLPLQLNTLNPNDVKVSLGESSLGYGESFTSLELISFILVLLFAPVVQQSPRYYYWSSWAGNTFAAGRSCQQEWVSRRLIDIVNATRARCRTKRSPKTETRWRLSVGQIWRSLWPRQGRSSPSGLQDRCSLSRSTSFDCLGAWKLMSKFLACVA